MPDKCSRLEVSPPATSKRTGRLVDGTLDALINQNLHSTIMNSVRIFANLRAKREAIAGIEPMAISVVLNENLP